MNIQEWFNPENEEHLKAYLHLEKTGCWPKGFIPDNMDFSPCWQVRLIDKMANLWIESQLKLKKV